MIAMNSGFGWVVQPLSVFKVMNIEFGCALQPKSGFNNVNIEFGCPAPAPASAADRCSGEPSCGQRRAGAHRVGSR